MSLASWLLDYNASALDPNDDRLFSDDIPYQSQSGVPVTADSSLAQSCVFACARLISSAAAQLPLPVFKRLNPDERERVPAVQGVNNSSNIAYLFKKRPNRWQSPFEFRQMQTMHIATRGNCYAEIKSGPKGFAEELWPMHPDLVEGVEQLSNMRLVYHVRNPDGTKRKINQDNMFHVRDISMNGITGLSRVTLAREGIGLALVAELTSNRFFSSGNKPGVVLKTEKSIPKKADRDEIRQGFTSTHGNPFATFKPLILHGGMDLHQYTLSNTDSQFLESRKFQIGDIARFYGVPPHMIGDLERSTSWGSGIEQQSIGFVVYTLGPWLTMWEQAIDRQLLLDDTVEYFPEHIVDGLLRGDFKTRMEGYDIQIGNGMLSPDEGRQLENRNKRADGDGGKFVSKHEQKPDPPQEPTPPPPGKKNGGGQVQVGVE